MRNRIDGGTSVVKWLQSAGVRRVFSVSGGPINPVYHACAVHGLPLVHTRHEAAACFMAEAAARVTGTPGAAVVTLGPGVTNTVTSSLVATMAGTPLIIIGAQAGTATFDRGAGMSWDPLPILESVTKWSGRVLDVKRIPEYLDIAWRKMWSGRPGPVFLEIPVDILSREIENEADLPKSDGPLRPSGTDLLPKDKSRLLDALSGAARPLMLLGDELFWDRPASAQAVIDRHGIPFATLRLARGILDETQDHWIGPGYVPCNGALRQALSEADLILLIGHHFEFDLGYGDGVGADAKIVQIAADPDLLGRNRRADLAFAASPSSVVATLASASKFEIDRTWVQSIITAWHDEWRMQAVKDGNGVMHPITAVDAVSEVVPDNTIFVTSHGNVDFWADARLRIRAPGRYLRAGQSGALGAEIPYGLGASFANQEAPVVVFVGDGGVGYHITELDTAERYGRAFVIVVLDDESWGAIALPQKERYGETYEMSLPRRDWVRVAEGLGCRGAFAENTEALKSALKKAIETKMTTVIQTPVRSVVSPYMDYISK